MGRRIRRGVGLSLPGLAFVAWAGCRAPTQVTIVITSPVLACGAGAGTLRGATVTVAGDPKIAEERTTNDVTAEVPCPTGAHELGTLVVTPGESERAAVVVVAGVEVPVDECSRDDGYKGCIVARRTLSFVEHVRLTVPIALDPSCVSKVCPVYQTCQNATCVSSGLDCNESGSCSPAPASDGGAPPGVDAGTDGGVDGGPIIGTDGGVPPLAICPTGCGGIPAPGCLPGFVCCTADVTVKGSGGEEQCKVPSLCTQSFSGGLTEHTSLCCRSPHECEGASPDMPKCCLAKDGSSSYCAKGCGNDTYELCNVGDLISTCSKGACGVLHDKAPKIDACFTAND